MKHTKRAFTLIELMVVVSIIIILASLAVPSFVKYRETSIAAKCVSNLRCIQDAREAYFMENIGVNEISGDESEFLKHFGTPVETAGAGGTRVYTVDDTGLIVCPYNAKKYSMGVSLDNITVMPACPNVGVTACAGHVYSPR